VRIVSRPDIIITRRRVPKSSPKTDEHRPAHNTRHITHATTPPRRHDNCIICIAWSEQFGVVDNERNIVCVCVCVCASARYRDVTRVSSDRRVTPPRQNENSPVYVYTRGAALPATAEKNRPGDHLRGRSTTRIPRSEIVRAEGSVTLLLLSLFVGVVYVSFAIHIYIKYRRLYGYKGLSISPCLIESFVFNHDSPFAYDIV